MTYDLPVQIETATGARFLTAPHRETAAAPMENAATS
jgi:hypothetical protein